MDHPMVEFDRALRMLRRWWWMILVAAVVGAVAGLVQGGEGPRVSMRATIVVAPEGGVALLRDIQSRSNLVDGLPLESTLGELEDGLFVDRSGADGGGGVDMSHEVGSGLEGARIVTLTVVASDATSARAFLDAAVISFRSRLENVVAGRLDAVDELLMQAQGAGADVGLEQAVVAGMRSSDFVQSVNTEVVSSSGTAAALPVLLAIALSVCAAGVLVLLSPLDRRLHSDADVRRFVAPGVLVFDLRRGLGEAELALSCASACDSASRVLLVPVGGADSAGLVAKLNRLADELSLGNLGVLAEETLSVNSIRRLERHAQLLLIVSSGSDQREQLSQALRLCRAVGREVSGLVLTDS